MSRELHYGDPVVWVEIQMRWDAARQKRHAVEVHRHGSFRRLWSYQDGDIAVLTDKVGQVVNVPMAVVELDEEALAKRQAAPRGMV